MYWGGIGVHSLGDGSSGDLVKIQLDEVSVLCVSTGGWKVWLIGRGTGCGWYEGFRVASPFERYGGGLGHMS